uniref:Uncharacterized protein n=1 Tax=Aegilops tauschii subsp. strangulata TaxID=200361 RepID=A0A453KY84_AEGTS
MCLQTATLRSLNYKPRTTAKALRSWHGPNHSDLRLRGTIIAELIFRLDIAGDARTLSQAGISLRGLLKMQSLGIAATERSTRRQKSRFLTLKDGASNSRLFRVHASSRRRKNHILDLQRDGALVTDDSEKMDMIWSHFNSLLGCTSDRPHTLNLEALNVPAIDLSALLMHLSLKMRLKVQFFSCTHGPDGFT